MFPAVEKNESFADRELAVGKFWKEQGIYDKTLAARAEAENFVFYEGPPTANGLPHPGHCLTRAIKDLFPRYKTMRGYRCERKAGWDTHGLPVEVEVCKELGIHSKEEIEEYGIEPFIQKCQQSVWRYMQEWERLTERLGFWVNLEDAYVTYHQSYVESVWWSLKTLFDRGQLYQGHKIVWWWAQGGTALSAGEVGQGYREVADPSVYVKFPLLDDEHKEVGVSLLVWTTTPWTLPSNQFAAINPKLKYCNVFDEKAGETYIVAEQLVQLLREKTKLDLKITGAVDASGLIGHAYQPPFDCFCDSLNLIGKDAEAINKSFKDEAWYIVDADFVTTDSGTGIVHIAPAFGEDDYLVLDKERTKAVERFGAIEAALELINCVGPDGKFTDEAPEFVRGRWVKDCDKDITRDLKERGLLFHQEQYRHDYPFCWRAEEDPLIQYPRESWFIRTTDAKEQMLANNAEINWLPGHIKDGRFGKFLESNVDWALSRERYWGTPLPIWQCEATGKQEAIGSYDELLAKPGVTGTEVWEKAKAANPELPDDLRVHKPYIDEVTYDSPFAASSEGGARMRRVTEVIDCWYDSGAMPFAQWGYRGQESGLEKQRFESQFPADFISEAIDQTRGWFYSQLAISTMMFGSESRVSGRESREVEGTENSRLATRDSQLPHPFKNCIVLGLMLSEWWENKKDSKQLFLTEEEAKAACGAKNVSHQVGKMSKSKRNYREPREIFDNYGADALRWYFFANQPPWTSIRYSEPAIKDSIPEFLLRLWNVYSFFTIYANIDGFDPKDEGGRRKAESELDRWIVSELNSTLAVVVERMDAYDNYAACQAITEFVDALSNWYVRRSRDRFWASDKRSPEKLDAYWTLYECLLTSAKMIAPFVPFLAESLWQKLAVAVLGEDVPQSVHLCDYPMASPQAIDEALSTQMNLVREITSLGRQARSGAELKVRQPLAKVEVILADATHQPWLESHAGLIAEELNVKAVEFTENAEQYIDYTIVPNFKRLGPKLGKNMPKVKKLLGDIDGGQMLSELKSVGKVTLDLGDVDSIDASIELDEEDIEVRLQAKEGWTAAQGRGAVVVLATELTAELLAEGLARDVVRVIQDVRKEKDCEFTDRIKIGFVTESSELRSAIEQFQEYITQETLADQIVFEALAGVEPSNVKIGDAAAKIDVQVAS